MVTQTPIYIACVLKLPVLLSIISTLTQASRGFRIKQFREIWIIKELQPFCDEIAVYVIRIL